MSKRQHVESGDLPRLFKPEEIATALGCSDWWVKEQARRRRIPFTRVGGGYRFTAEHFAEIVDLFEERPVRSATEPIPSLVPAARPRRRPSREPAARLRARPPRRARKSESLSVTS